MLLGVDLSSYAGTGVDWGKVASAGFSFAINRACLDLRPDPTWARNDREARKYGLVPGAYDFLYSSGGSGSARQPAAAQCDAFLNVIGDPEGLIVALDVESDGGGVYQPTYADVDDWVHHFHHYWPTHPLVIYTGAWYWNSPSHPIHNANAAALGLLWDSRYVAVTPPRTAQHLLASVPASWWTPGFGGWPKVTILQFSSSAAVPGVSGNCDVSAFAGTIDQLRALTVSVAAAPAPKPPEVNVAGILVALDITSATTPAARAAAIGTASIVGAKHGAVNLASRKVDIPLPDGTPLGTCLAGTCLEDVGFLAKGERVVVYNAGTPPVVHLSPWRDIGATWKALPVPADSTPFSQADLDAKAKLATGVAYERAHAAAVKGAGDAIDALSKEVVPHG